MQARKPIDLLLVAPGTTMGWRRADSELVRLLEELGNDVATCTSDYRIARHFRRTILTTDLAEAMAMRWAVQRALRRYVPRAIVFSSSQAAMVQPASRLRRSAIRFDVPAAMNRQGFGSGLLHALEHRAMSRMRVLLPWGLDAGGDLAEGLDDVPMVPLPVSIDVRARNRLEREPTALAYAGNPGKKGLDIVVGSWAQRAPAGWRLVVTGIDAALGRRFLRQRGMDVPAGMEWAGNLDSDAYHDLLDRATLFLSASRYEDYGLAQLEALGRGAMLVTCPSRGRYEALSIQRELDPRLVAADCSSQALGRALAVALSLSTEERLSLQKRARMHLQPYSRDEVKRRLSEDVLPLLLP